MKTGMWWHPVFAFFLICSLSVGTTECETRSTVDLTYPWGLFEHAGVGQFKTISHTSGWSLMKHHPRRESCYSYYKIWKTLFVWNKLQFTTDTNKFQKHVKYKQGVRPQTDKHVFSLHFLQTWKTKFLFNSVTPAPFVSNPVHGLPLMHHA